MSDVEEANKIPCDCGNPNASWRGSLTGRREYSCEKCYNYSRSGAANKFLGKYDNSNEEKRK